MRVTATIYGALTVRESSFLGLLIYSLQHPYVEELLSLHPPPKKIEAWKCSVLQTQGFRGSHPPPMSPCLCSALWPTAHPPQRCLPSPRTLAPSHLNWCSRELRILEENRSASFSRLREYSSSISAFRRKNSWRSCSSCSLDSDCCSKHLNCSTSCVRISAGRGKERMGH